MTLVSFPKMLRFKQKKQQHEEEQVEAIKDTSSFETQEDDDYDSAQEEEPTQEPVEPTVEYSSVPVETDQPSETELILTTTTTTVLEDEEDLLPPTGMMDQCTKVCELDEQAEIILNTNDVSRCTSVLIERHGHKSSETEMVLTTARMKTVSEQQEDIIQEEEEEDVAEQEEGEDSIPEVIPCSDEDFIVVLTDNNKEEEDLQEEQKQEEVKEEEFKQEEDPAMTIENAASDSVSVSLQSYMAVPNVTTTTATPAPLVQDFVIVPQQQQQDDDSSLVPDSVSVSLQSYQNGIAKQTKFYGQSARRTFAPVLAVPAVVAPVPNQHRGNLVCRQQQQEETKEEEPIDNYSTVSQWGRQLDDDDETNADHNLLSALLPAATVLSEQHDWLVQYLHSVAAAALESQSRRPEESNFSIVDEDDATALDLSIATDVSTVPPPQDPLAFLHDFIDYSNNALTPTLPNLDRELVVLAQTLDPSQLGHLVANNDWLQQKAKEKAGLQRREFQEIMSDLLFL